MIVALIILASLVAVGLPLYLLHRRDEAASAGSSPEKSEPSPAAGTPSPAPAAPRSGAPGDSPDGAATSGTPEPESDIEIDDEVCCGMHITCEKDSLLASVSAEVEYFDDEELDRFAGRDAEGYSPDEIEEFRDVLLTLIPTDIAPWARSIQLRGITLPAEVREELLMIVAEARKGDVN